MIYEASFSGILRIIFWMLIISFIIRIVVRLAMPHVIKKGEQVMRERMKQMHEQQKPPRHEGEVTVENKTKKDGKRDDGDYVDYVEIRE